MCIIILYTDEYNNNNENRKYLNKHLVGQSKNLKNKCKKNHLSLTQDWCIKHKVFILVKLKKQNMQGHEYDQDQNG